MAVGTVVPVLEREIDLPSMVAYAGATWDWHRMHYDLEFLAARGIERPVVDGQVLGALLAEQAMDWYGGRSFPASISFRLRSMVLAGDVVRVEGQVSAVDEATGQITIEQKVTVGDAVAATGTTVLSSEGLR